MTGSGVFERQRALVVGAASGIGRAVATRLAADGAAVVSADIDEEGVRKAVDEQRAAGGSGHALPVDVRDPDSIAATVAEARAVLDGLDILVNCVGVTGATHVLSHEVAIEDFDEVCRINLRGAFLLSRAVLPGMVAAGYGRVLHVASIAGKEGNAGMVSYSATKAGLIGMVKSQGKEYATTGVTVNALAPAVIHTPLVDAMPPEQVRRNTERIPMQRTGTLDEAADMVAWIVSPACSFTTGFTFDLSGGRAVY